MNDDDYDDDDDDDMMEIRKPNLASDDAVFFADLLEQGCAWHLAPGKQYLCRRNGPNWENALTYQMTNFPEQEVVDGISSSAATKLWVEPIDWHPLDLAPNQSLAEGSLMFGIMVSSTRFPPADSEVLKEQWQRFLERCSGKTHRQVFEEDDTIW